MFVEFVEDETHTIDQTVHVTWSVIATILTPFNQGCLESFEVSHPLESKGVILNVSFIED